MGGMEKTTVYLTTDQKRALETAARAAGRSEAHLIREGIEAITASRRVAEAAAPLLDEPRPGAADGDAAVAGRRRWMPRDEFVRLMARPADVGLRGELLRLSPDTTDDVAVR
jgi:hypothetical protein